MIKAETNFHGYQVLSLIAEGGMGSVYLAEDPILCRLVAIKTISAKCKDSEAQARFIREARAMARIQHRNIVQIFSFHQDQEKTCIVMEYIPGETLSERIKRSGRLSCGTTLRILSAVTEALQEASKERIVHRDVKPSNILIDRNNRVCLSDFGLAKCMDEDSHITGSGLFVGTPNYVSPELAQGLEIDFRSDIYSLGIVFYEMLIGEPPFQANTPVAVVAQHMYTPLPQLRSKQPEIPVDVARLLDWMTRKDPSERPASYDALLSALHALRQIYADEPEFYGSFSAGLSSSAETIPC